MSDTRLMKMNFNKEPFLCLRSEADKDTMEPVCDRVIELVDSVLKELDIRSNNGESFIALSKGDFQRLLFVISSKSMCYENSRLTNLVNKLSSYSSTTVNDVAELVCAYSSSLLFQSHQ